MPLERMSHANVGTAARQIALRRLGRLFALLDGAVTRGDLDVAKSLLVEVREALRAAKEAELGATNLNATSDETERR